MDPVLVVADGDLSRSGRAVTPPAARSPRRGGRRLKVTHNVDTDHALGRQDFAPITAPAGTTAVKFFASTNYDWVKWDCVYLQLAAFTVTKQVQDPASGQWVSTATLPSGSTAHYRITVTNVGTQTLSGITVNDPWCASRPSGSPFSLDGGASKQLTCDHPNVTTADDGHTNTTSVCGAAYPAGAAPSGVLPCQTASATIHVTPPPATDQVGDFVWYDANGNGIQDAGEPGVCGVTATLADGNGKSLATTKTDCNGKYLFDNLTDGTYQVCFTLSSATAPYNGGNYTRQNTAGHNGTDSAANPATGCTATTTLGPTKRQDLALDAGIVLPAPPTPTPPAPPAGQNEVGDFVWYDTNDNGIQDTGERGVCGMAVTLQDGNGKSLATTKTDCNGKYLFPGLADGTYQVCFALGSVTPVYPGATFTRQNAAGHNGTDSAANPSNGCTATTALGPNKRQDLTLDAGIVQQMPSAPLAYTGVPVGPLAGLAGLLILAGALALYLRRRRTATDK